MSRLNVQIIEKKGKPEWAVIPYEEFLRLCELEELSKDIHAFKVALARNQEELIPDEYAKRLIRGENAIRVWREYRKLTQRELAKATGISVPYLSQLERGERHASVLVLKKIAEALTVSLDDLAGCI